MPPYITDTSRRPIAIWLLVCCALVFAIVVVGGATRLTQSGLSIVEWKPLVGAIPPLDDAQWEEAFAQYRKTPEFRLRNPGMTLAGFKGIFWWEYAHRLLGRVIGVVFLLPLAWFWWRGALDRPLKWKLGTVFVLGAVQGALGWYMVKSGLVDDPRVSPVRLAAHLGLAFVIFAAMFWIALDLLVPAEVRDRRGPRAWVALVAILVFVMVLSGALVAGTRAGYAYNTFPLMNGRWIPPDLLSLQPAWQNFVHNLATVQFVHRALAALIVVLVLPLWWRVDTDRNLGERTHRWSMLLLIALALQVAAGIATLLMRVPLVLAVAHQAGALLVFTCALGMLHSLSGVEVTRVKFGHREM
jgi:cytochrome c oxidase assembly protein subunit 15